MDEEGTLDAESKMPTIEELVAGKYDYQQPRRGDIRKGIVLSVGPEEIIVDLNVKREGIVPHSDLQRLGEDVLSKIHVGDEVPVYVLRPEDKNGNMVVSIHRARLEEDWLTAQELLESGEVWEGEVIDHNRGGVIVSFGKIRGFVPASHLSDFPHRLSPEDKETRLQEMKGKRLRLKVIEVDRRRRRLILSERAGNRAWRKEQRERLLNELCEGDVVHGTVSNLCNFGAFVDLGGADGLVHISELSWRRVRHPREVLNVGDEVDVYVLHLDRERKRIGLSIRRLQPDPWSLVDDRYDLGQLVEGVVTKVVDFGAFVLIKEGIEGLIHLSEMATPPPTTPQEVLTEGQRVLARIVKLDSQRRRLGLSLKHVMDWEREQWEATHPPAETWQKEEAPEQEWIEEETEPVEIPPEEPERDESEEIPLPEPEEAPVGEAETETEEEAPEQEWLEEKTEPAEIPPGEPERDESEEIPLPEPEEAPVSEAETETTAEMEGDGDEEEGVPAEERDADFTEAVPVFDLSEES